MIEEPTDEEDNVAAALPPIPGASLLGGALSRMFPKRNTLLAMSVVRHVLHELYRGMLV